MKDAARQTRSHLMKTFEDRGYHPRSDLGQNFLIDLNLLGYVVEKAHLTPDDVVLEVGTGTGGMTALMARQAGHVVSVEVDKRVYELAREATADCPNVTLLHTDALKNKNHLHPLVLEALREQLALDPGRRLKLVANLPYCIGTPVISNLLSLDFPLEMMVVTIQLELAERMQAPPKTDDYGSLTVWLQSQCDVHLLKKLKPACFWPRPNVDSAIVQIIPRPEKRAQITDRDFFHDMIRRAFHHRRKSLRKVLVGMYSQQLSKPQVDAVLHEVGLPETIRIEDLDIATLTRLATALQRAQTATAPCQPVEKGD